MKENNKPTRKELRSRIKELMPKTGKGIVKLIESLVRPFLRIRMNYNAVHSEDAYFYQLVYSAPRKQSGYNIFLGAISEPTNMSRFFCGFTIKQC